MSKRLSSKDILDMQFRLLSRCVKNLLVDNPNLKFKDEQAFGGELPYYFKEYPRTPQYVNGPLREQTEYILEKIEVLREIATSFVDSYEAERREISEIVNNGS